LGDLTDDLDCAAARDRRDIVALGLRQSATGGAVVDHGFARAEPRHGRTDRGSDVAPAMASPRTSVTLSVYVGST
jgi:hypothetical protein